MRFPFVDWEHRNLLATVVAAFSVPAIILLAITVFYIVESSLAINLAVKVNDMYYNLILRHNPSIYK